MSASAPRHERPVVMAAARAGRARRPGPGGRPLSVLDLQRAAGNQATTAAIRQASTRTPLDLVPSHPHDHRERAADEAADALTAGRPATVAQAPAPGAPVPPAPPGLGPGQPLPAELRPRFEAFFGHDLGRVRVHTHPAGARMAADLDASAFTVGRDVVFGAGRFRPGTPAGDRLLAHELAHVVAGHGAGDPRTALRQAKKPDTAPGQSKGAPFYFTVRLSGTPLDSDALLIEFIRQYYRLASTAEAIRMRDTRDWSWAGSPRVVTAADLRRGYIRLAVRDHSTPVVSAAEHQQRDEYYAQLPGGEQADINDETNRLFWDRARYRPGEPLGHSPADQAMAPYWQALRDELLRQRKAIADLPPPVRELMFAGDDRSLAPGTYGDVLRIAGKLQTLSGDELTGLQDRLSARAAQGDWSNFERYVDSYLAERLARRNAAQDRNGLAGRLADAKPLYDRYRQLTGLQHTSGLALSAAGAGMPGVPAVPERAPNTEWAKLTADLRGAGFDSVADFAAAVEAWREAFRVETVAVAGDLLDRYEASLAKAERTYRAPGAPARLYQQLAPARQHYAEAEQGRPENPESPTADGRPAQEEYLLRRAEQEAQGSAAVTTLSPELPVVADPGFPRRDLATRPEGGVASVLQDYIAARHADIATTRGNLAASPDMVFGLDRLLEASYQAQEIQSGSVFDEIVRDYATRLTVQKAIVSLGVAVIALALGAVSGGAGTVAVLAAAGAAGIGVASAILEFRGYEEQSAAHGAQLLSDDPSFAWVIVAIVGAGIDVGAAARAFSASAGLRTAVRSFNGTRDLARLRQQVERLADVDKKLQRTVIAAAEARAAEDARAAERFAEWFPQGAARASLLLLDRPVELVVRLAYATYLTASRGVRSFRLFLLEREAAALFGEVSRLSPAQLSRLEVAFDHAVAVSDRVAGYGKSLGMTDDEIAYFFRLWIRNERLSADQLMTQMRGWTAGLGGGARRYRTAPDIVLDARSRNVLPQPHRHRIAGTGGIERITASRTPEDGISVAIEGNIRPGLAREAEKVTPDRPRAPDFNLDRRYAMLKTGLPQPHDWELLHLWGPGFGDEAAAGMMLGPKEINHVWQNQSIESYIRRLGEQARREKGAVQLKATATAWKSPAPSGGLFLKEAHYEVTLVLPGKPPQTIRVWLETAEPPVAKLARPPGWDPPWAADLANLL